MQDKVEQKFPQSKIDFVGTKADRNILTVYSRFKREYSSGKRSETVHKKDVAAILVELGYDYLRHHGFNLTKAREGFK